MAYYHTCVHCGCNLDPGERCDCETEREEKNKVFENIITEIGGQLRLNMEGMRYEEKMAM